MSQLDHCATVAAIVTRHPAAARVFQKHGIDYCCHGDVSVREACRGAGLDPEALYAELEAAAGEVRQEEDPRTLSSAALVARIVDRHHGYLRKALPYIGPIAAKVARVHGPRDPGLQTLEETFQGLAASLGPHLDDEEEVLFPALLARGRDPGVLGRELGRMRQEHLQVGDLLSRIRTLTRGFATPDWACNTYRVLMAELNALEADILEHVHLENHVLAPRFEAPAPGPARAPAASGLGLAETGP
jgi:regulator of cell morphogenesis and NO signaling